MLIRPKRIYNFCLLHACFVWYCYDLDTLSYTFDHICTNLLTQCTLVPVPVFCCFSISVFPHIKRTRKIPGKIQKQSAYRKLREEPGRGHRGARGAQAATRRGPTPGRARGAPGAVHLWLPPFAYLFSVTGKPRERNPIPQTRLCSAAAALPKIGSTRRPLPGTLPEGRSTSGSLLSTMDAPRMSRE